MDIIANGVRLNYIEAGQGEAVVCLHGLGLNKDVWRHLFPLLSQHYRTIAYDLRGMGRSEAPGRRGLTYTIDFHAEDLESLLDRLKIGQIAIVAHAFGAFVAMRFALKQPERVTAMVIVNTSAMMGEPGISQGLYRAATAELEGMAPLLDVAMSRWFVESVHRNHPEVIQFYREMLGSTPPMGYAANARSLALWDFRSQLGKIRCPTLVVAGKEDWSTPPEGHKVIAQGISDSRFVVIENASHTVPEEQADEFNRLTLEYLEQHVTR
jgi:3-oxoadipate enol-lactonase